MKKIITLLLFSALVVFLSIGMAQAKSVKYKLTMSINNTAIEAGMKITISGKITPTKETRVWVLKSSTKKGKYRKMKSAKTKKGEYSIKVRINKERYIKVMAVVNGKEILSKPQKITVLNKFSMVTPYVNESDVSSINEAYGLLETSPWGFAHSGVDFMITTDLVPFQAVTDGIIGRIDTRKSENQQGWNTQFCIEHVNFAPCYNFETFSQDDAIGQKQLDNIYVHTGDLVRMGDIIGKLVYGGSGAHIDFGLINSNARICPESYFTSDAAASIMRLIQKDHPAWQMCY